MSESFSRRSFTDAMERAGAEVGRLEAAFNEHNIRAIEQRQPTMRWHDPGSTPSSDS